MKSTTFQQKSILTIKIAVCAFVMGLLGWLSFAAPPPAEAASDVTLSVTITTHPPAVYPTAPLNVGNSVPISGDTVNIVVGPVEGVYLVHGGGSRTKLDGNVTVASDGTLSGSVNMPPGLPDGLYTLIVVGETAQTDGGIFPLTAEGAVVVQFTNEGPKVNCVHNLDTLCDLPPNDGKNAFGDNDKDTEIIIDGENFVDGDTDVTVGGKKCTILSITANQIRCRVPASPGTTGPQDVTVCVNGAVRLCSTKIGGFTFVGRVPNVPNTGLFRIGDTVVTLKDVMWWGGLAVILAATAMLIMIVKTPAKARYSVKSGASKKRNYRKQKVSFSTKKKSPKRR